MTAELEKDFRERGIVLLRRAVDGRQLAPLRAHILDELRRLRIWSYGKVLSAAIRDLPAFQQIAKLSGLIQRDDLASRLIPGDVLSTIGTLAGAKPSRTQSQVLISLPRQGEWTLANLNWHTDLSSPSAGRLPGIQAFVLVDDVEPRGGATLAIAGSHLQSGRRGAGADIRRILRTDNDPEQALRSHGLSVVELCGDAGDVYLMDLRMLHTPAINETRHVRLMATVRYFVASDRRTTSILT